MNMVLTLMLGLSTAAIIVVIYSNQKRRERDNRIRLWKRIEARMKTYQNDIDVVKAKEDFFKEK